MFGTKEGFFGSSTIQGRVLWIQEGVLGVLASQSLVEEATCWRRVFLQVGSSKSVLEGGLLVEWIKEKGWKVFDLLDSLYLVPGSWFF